MSGDNQAFMGADNKIFHPWAEPGEGSTIAEVKRTLCAQVFKHNGEEVRSRVCTLRPDDVDLVYHGKGDNVFGRMVEMLQKTTVTVTSPSTEPQQIDDVNFALFESMATFTLPSRENGAISRVNEALKLADCRVGPTKGETKEDMEGEHGEFPFWVTDDKKKLIFSAPNEETQMAMIAAIEKTIVTAQTTRRETATVRDAKKGNILADDRTLADFRITQGDCFELRRKPGMSAAAYQPEPEMQSQSGLMGQDSRETLGITFDSDHISEAQHKEEQLDSEAHEGDEDFKAKVTTKQTNISKAAGQFVSKSKNEIIDMVKETLEGHQRAIMAELTVDEIYKDRLMFQRKVRETADVDLAKMGLRVISYTLKDVSDANGYMMSLGVRRIEEVKKEARMGEAQEKSEADQRCANFQAQTVQTKKKCEAEIASAKKNFTMREQEWKNEVAEAQQEALMATALEMQVQEKIIAELAGAVDATRVKWQTKIDELEKERKEKDLEASQNLKAKYSKDRANLINDAQTKASIAVAEANSKMVTSVAQAEADVIKSQGDAAADVMEKQAEAWSQYSDKAYVDMITEKLPEIAAGLVAPLNKIDKMVLINVSHQTNRHITSPAHRTHLFPMQQEARAQPSKPPFFAARVLLPLTLMLTVVVRRATATSVRPRSQPRLLTSCRRSRTWSSRSPAWTSSPCSRASRASEVSDEYIRKKKRRRGVGACACVRM